ncbi:hypothetical protein [Arthrobacter jinronghuae]|uniref:hypothetical protein n=1 Tax=Arthrobacter jinronghuae TaxID=2964609 RepID=UPI0021AF662A|nr:hypothetical protein [Arthrobacter jinronghuae]UWX79397.1 hypothetical protein N2K98_04065 [Arthrobacter jinronghuae]
MGIPDDPSGYRFEPVCFDDLAGDVSCLAANQAACTAGEDGRLVYWFSGLKGTDPSTWTKVSETPSCIYSEEPVDVGEQIQAQILTAFQERPIAAGKLVLQPSPHTLIGMETNVYVEAAEQVFEMVLLEQTVRIVATPTEFELNYGDGTVYGPTSVPGAPLAQDRWGEQTQTSHKYTASGDYQVGATVHFSGTYSVNGGPMSPIDGRAAVSSEPQTLSVWRAETRSVADNCLVNPSGVGC